MKRNDSLKSLMALVLVLGLTSCQTPGNSSGSNESAGSSETMSAIHEHTFADEWSKDETHHWKASTCGHADAETKVEHAFGNPVETTENLVTKTTWTCTDCGYEKVETSTSLVINYKLPDGTLIDSTTQEVKPGEAYSIASPKVKFMAPSVATVEGTMDADGEIVDVVYDYSSDAMETQVSPGRDMGKLYVDDKKGLSISYVMKGSTGDWEQVFQGNTFAIYNGCIRVRDGLPAERYAGDWYDGNNAVNGAAWNALLSSNTEEILVTWSFNADGSIHVYKNGKMVFLFAASTPANGKWTASGQSHNLMVSDVTEALFAEVAEKGLTLGAFIDNGSNPVSWSMRDLSVGYAMDMKEAAEYASQYKVVKAQYVDENKNQVRTPLITMSKIGAEYSIEAEAIPGYTAVSQTVTGTVTPETSVIELSYTRNGEEKVSSPVVRDRFNEGGWNDSSYWVYIADGLTGDFTVTSEYILNAGAITTGDAWKTSIGIVYDSNNKGNRVTARFDWAGWQDGSLCGSHSNGSMWCGSMEEYYAVAADCTVRTIYTRVGNTITCANVITANSGQYAGNVYFWTTTIYDVNKDSIGLALSPEMAKITLVSVKY